MRSDLDHARPLVLVLGLALALCPWATGCGGGSSEAPPAEPGGHHHRHAMHHRFEDPAAWSAEFDAPERDAWQRPAEVIEALGLAPDAVVADLGAGTGYFSVRLARAVPAGRVLAIDVEPAMVRHLADRAQAEELPNLLAVEATATDSGLREPVDLVLVVDTYHHIEAREAYFAALRERLRPGGRVAVVDFRLDSERGPPRAMKIAPDEVIRELGVAGYRLAAQHDFLPDQYFLVFERAP